jgi:hypothetical protein
MTWREEKELFLYAHYFCWVAVAGQSNHLANGHNYARDSARLDLFLFTEKACTDPNLETCKESDPAWNEVACK